MAVTNHIHTNSLHLFAMFFLVIWWEYVLHLCVFRHPPHLRLCSTLGFFFRVGEVVFKKVIFVNYRVFVCLFKRRGSIPNKNTVVKNASLSFKQASKHSIITKNNFLEYKQNPFIFTYPTLIWQLTKLNKLKKNCKIGKSARKKRKSGWSLTQALTIFFLYFEGPYKSALIAAPRLLLRPGRNRKAPQ